MRIQSLQAEAGAGTPNLAGTNRKLREIQRTARIWVTPEANSSFVTKIRKWMEPLGDQQNVNT